MLLCGCKPLHELQSLERESSCKPEGKKRKEMVESKERCCITFVLICEFALRTKPFSPYSVCDFFLKETKYLRYLPYFNLLYENR